MLHLLATFLESAPQLVLQLCIVVQTRTLQALQGRGSFNLFGFYHFRKMSFLYTHIYPSFKLLCALSSWHRSRSCLPAVIKLLTMTLSRKPVVGGFFFSLSYWPWVVGRIYNVLLSACPCNRRALLIIHWANVKIASIKLLLFSLCFFLWMYKPFQPAVMRFICYYAKHRKRRSRKQLFCEENAGVCGIPVPQFSAMFMWNNTSHLLSVTKIFLPSSSGFPSKVDAFSKRHFCF